jgi:hypothetical protein
VGRLAWLLIVHATIMVLGSLLIWWIATPIALHGDDGLSSLPWPLLVTLALILAVVAGVPEGLLVPTAGPASPSPS